MKPSDFPRFFQELHEHEPFPWQRRLAEELCRTHAWPDIIDLPTGAGKTACIDIALFHWFVCASNGAPRASARRIAFVVDRRIIVDEAADRARKISDKIAKSTTPLLSACRELLETLTSESRIDVVTLRGGVEREKNLARDPTVVTVILSTVDQLGSRLLFRGYGVSDRMKPLHAGIFGVDTHLLLDEAHIAEPFQQTLRGILREQTRAEIGLIGPKALTWSQLSATPKNVSTTARIFTIDADDRAHPVLKRRLDAKKPMRLLEVAKREELPKKLTELVIAELEQLAAAPLSNAEQPRIGVVVNRVATARELFNELDKKLKGRTELELVIGRVRPIDRDARMADLAPKLKATTAARPGAKPVVVVATQTIEVGADFDFHVMLVEAASYSAIKQRVGRLNRLGVRDAARGDIVLVRDGADDDPVYLGTIAATWELLQKNAVDGVVDLGIGFAPVAPDDASSPRSKPAPLLSPSLIHLLVQTCPRPAVEPDPAELLHGFATEVADVSIVWRDGIAVADAEKNVDVGLARAVLDALPALSLEAMSLPFFTFKQWVRTWDTPKAPRVLDTGDVDGDYQHEDDVKETSRSEVLVVSGEEPRLVRISDVRPGMQVVVPTARGGADRFGFAPDSASPVTDLALLARDPRLRGGAATGTDAAREGRVATLVWTRAFAESWFVSDDGAEKRAFDGSVSELAQHLDDEELERDDVFEDVEAWFSENRSRLRADVVATFDRIVPGSRSRWDWLEVNRERRGVILQASKLGAGDLVELDGGLQRTVKVSLTDHSVGVAEFAARFSEQVGLSEPLQRALRTAGYVHDFGKADPRFQSRLEARAGELLAKSDRYDKKVVTGERHEVYSVAVLDRHPELLAGDPDHEDLIRYLVGSHHGFGRGFHPVTEDRGISFSAEINGVAIAYTGRPVMSGLESGWTELFIDLNRRYGPWGLAYLEALLRLADHRRSEKEMVEA